MYIKEIKSYYEEGKEADLIISDGAFELMAYAQPFLKRFKDEKFKLIAFTSENIMTIDKEEYAIEKTNEGYYSYWFKGKLLDAKKGIVAINNIIIEDVGWIPKDIHDGQFIEFTCQRVDYVCAKNLYLIK